MGLFHNIFYAIVFIILLMLGLIVLILVTAIWMNPLITTIVIAVYAYIVVNILQIIA